MKPKKDNKILYIVMAGIVFIFSMFLCLHLGTVMVEDPGQDLISGIAAAFMHLESTPFQLSFSLGSLKYCGFGILIFAFIVLYIWTEDAKTKRDMVGKESGSAKWNTDMATFNKKFNDPYGKPQNDGPRNILLSQDVSLGIDSFKTQRNLNVVVIGGSGSGKSRFFIKPNILQANTSYVVTDPSGELLASTGQFLEEQGYKIKVFNLVNMEHSNRYNPFNYIRDDLGVVSLVNCLIKNTTPPGQHGGDPFWEKSETALLQALIFYLRECAPVHQQNFTSVMKLLRAAEVDENNLNKKSDLDRMFDALAKRNPNSIAIKQYLIFKQGSGKTLKSILISCSVRLTVFNMKEIEDLTGEDDIDLATLGSEKQALFVVLPQADDTYNFLASLMYSQLYETLYFQAENEWPYSSIISSDGKLLESVLKVASSDSDGLGSYDPKEKAEEMLEELKKTKLQYDDKTDKFYIEYKAYNTKTRKYDEKRRKIFATEEQGKGYLSSVKKAEITSGHKWLPSHVSFLLDEFANIGQIPEFDKKMATMRKYEISSVVVLQNLAQLKEIYDKKADGIVGNADSMVFLGSPEPETCKYISEKLGSATITARNRSHSTGGKGGGNMSYNQTKRELMTPDEVGRMPDTDCIVFVRGQQPFYGRKYDYVKHRNYKFTGDSDSANTYDITQISNRSVVEEKPAASIEEKLNEQRIKTEEYKQKMAAKHMRETSPVMPTDERLMKELGIDDPGDLPNVLSVIDAGPENIGRSKGKDRRRFVSKTSRTESRGGEKDSKTSEPVSKTEKRYANTEPVSSRAAMLRKAAAQEKEKENESTGSSAVKDRKASESQSVKKRKNPRTSDKDMETWNFG